MSDPILKFYVIKSKDGKYFRAKGYGGYGESWVDDIKRARVYQKPGGARGVISFFASTWPSFGIPDIIELHVTKEVVLDETKRVLKAKIKREQEEMKNKIRQLKRDIEEKFKDSERSQTELERLEKELFEIEKGK